jgi:large subunit ribosomal protein L21
MEETKSKPKTQNSKPETKAVKPKTESAPVKKAADKFAVIKTGGKQYIVEVGRFYEFEKLPGDEGAVINFEDVLMVVDGDNVQIGKPRVEGVKVSGKVLSQFKHETVRVFKYKKRKRTRKTYGHRQPLTKVEITAIK